MLHYRRVLKITPRPRVTAPSKVSAFFNNYYEQPNVSAIFNNYYEKPKVSTFFNNYCEKPKVSAIFNNYYEKPKVAAIFKVTAPSKVAASNIYFRNLW